MVAIRSESSNKFGYYVQDTGRGVYHYLMAAEPPYEQYILLDGAWQPLEDGYYLMDLIINGDVDLEGPTPNPPEGIPAAPVDF